MHNLDTIIGIMDIMIVKKGPDHQWRSDSQLLLDQYMGLAISIWPEVVSVLFEVANNDQRQFYDGDFWKGQQEQVCVKQKIVEDLSHLDDTILNGSP